jgi:hypothetical protein
MGKIIGAHNGIISNHHILQEKYKRNFEVDSQHLLMHINDGLSLAEIDGYGTVTYIDKAKPHEVFLGLGSTGDLAVAGIGLPSKTTGIVWSSVWTALEDALDIAGVHKYYQVKIDNRELYKVTNCDIYKAGKFNLSFIPLSTPNNYDGGCYGDHTYRGNMIGYTNPDQKKSPRMSRKKRKKLSKAFRELKDVITASRRGLLVNHTTNTTTPLCTSLINPPGYV